MACGDDPLDAAPEAPAEHADPPPEVARMDAHVPLAGDAGSDPPLARDAAREAMVPDAATPGMMMPGAPNEALFPARGARGVCPDAPLRIRFGAAPRLGMRGLIEVVDRDSGRRISLDMARPVVSVQRGGVAFNSERAAYVVGDTAVFYLPPLEPGHRYAVELGAEVVQGEKKPSTDRWTFEVAEPSAKASLRVADDGDFCTLQGALDAAAEGTQIELARGTYHGIVYATGKRRITIRGDDRAATRIVGTNNEMLNPGTAKRALVGLDASSEITFERLTIENLTPQGGSQAEALRLSRCDKCVLRNATVRSLQDTLLWSGRVYAEDSLIAGNVDFVWGTGSAYFARCEIATVGRSGYVVQARNPAEAYGYVFVDSRFTGDPGLGRSVLARIDASVYPASHVALVDCELGGHIDPVGWQVTGDSRTLRFWEYGSHDSAGKPIDVSRRHARSRQLTAEEAARMRDPSVSLSGWDPR